MIPKLGWGLGYGINDPHLAKDKSKEAIEQRLFLLKNAGAEWLRLGFSWEEIERVPGEFGFEKDYGDGDSFLLSTVVNRAD
jgi:hypothetical protein